MLREIVPDAETMDSIPKSGIQVPLVCVLWRSRYTPHPQMRTKYGLNAGYPGRVWAFILGWVGVWLGVMLGSTPLGVICRGCWALKSSKILILAIGLWSHILNAAVVSSTSHLPQNDTGYHTTLAYT